MYTARRFHFRDEVDVIGLTRWLLFVLDFKGIELDVGLAKAWHNRGAQLTKRHAA